MVVSVGGGVVDSVGGGGVAVSVGGGVVDSVGGVVVLVGGGGGVVDSVEGGCKWSFSRAPLYSFFKIFPSFVFRQ